MSGPQLPKQAAVAQRLENSLRKRRVEDSNPTKVKFLATSLVVLPPDLFIRGSFGSNPKCFRMRIGLRAQNKKISGTVVQQKVGPLLVVASAFSGPNDLKTKTKTKTKKKPNKSSKKIFFRNFSKLGQCRL